MQPVLYLDLDDTVISWASGDPKPVPGTREFLLWALERYEVRWLTRWARNGRMEAKLLVDLCKLTGVEVEKLRRIRGLNWEGTEAKVNGIAWLEHVVLGRPFLWVEDRTIIDADLEFLRVHGFESCYRLCDVTRDPSAVSRLHRELQGLPSEVSA